MGTDLDPNDTANPNDPGDFAQANAIPVNVDDFEEAQNQSGHGKPTQCLVPVNKHQFL